jgi:hypothetical protein
MLAKTILNLNGTSDIMTISFEMKKNFSEYPIILKTILQNGLMINLIHQNN